MSVQSAVAAILASPSNSEKVWYGIAEKELGHKPLQADCDAINNALAKAANPDPNLAALEFTKRKARRVLPMG